MTGPSEQQVLRRLRHVLVALGKSLTEIMDGAAQPSGGALDGQLRQIYEKAADCRHFVIIYLPAKYGAYSPKAVLRGLSAQLPRAKADGAEGREECVGDVEQVQHCVKCVIRNAAIGRGSGLHFAYFYNDGDPSFDFSLGAGGRFPEVFQIGRTFEIPLGELPERWTAVTSGGELRFSANVMAMFLSGDAAVSSGISQLEQVADPLNRLTQVLLPWRGASGIDEGNLVSEGEAAQLYSRAVREAAACVCEAAQRVN